jgi:O-antigen ligase
MRQLIILLLGLISLSGSIVGTFGTISIRDFELRGYVDPTQDINLPFIMPRLGVNVQLEQYDPSALRDNLELIQASNFVWVRQFAYWDTIEPTQGTYDWQTWDTIIEAIGDYPELELVVVLMNTPSWAREDSDTTQTAPPQSPEAFATFAHLFAERYGHAIDYYQIWDEPNLDDAWGLLDPRPAEYVALLSEAYQAIHNADATATVMSAALAPTTEQSGQNISDIQYLDAMYRLGAKDYMDIVAAKPYGFSMSPLDRTVDESTLNFSRIIALREVMLNYDDGEKSLWASHWGWNALPDDWQGDPSIWGAISQEEQAHYTLQALDRVHRELPWLGGMILHQWQPYVAPDNPQWGFALLDQDNNPTPLLEAIQSYNLPDLPQNGLYPARNNAARFSGVWTFSELGADIGWLETTDSQFEFDFVGTDIALLLNEGDYVAFLYPSVDNQPANATAMDNQGNAYIFLRSDSLNRESNLNPISTHLEHGMHTLHVVADKGWDQWAIGGFAVSSGNLEQPYNQQITVGIIAIIISSLVVITGIITVPWAQLYPVILPISRRINDTANLILSGVTSLVLMVAMLATWSTHKPNILARDEIHILVSIVTAGILYLSPNIIITLLSALVLFLLLYQRIESGLVLIVLWSPFFIFPVELYTFAFPTVEIILIITFGAWILRQLTAFGITLQMRNSQYPTFDIRQAISRLHMLDFGIIGIVLIAFLSLLWSQYPERAITELRQYIIEPAIFYVMIRSIRPQKQTYQQLVDALILAGVLVATIGLAQYVQGQGIITAEAGAKRLASVYGSPNNVGLMLGRAIPFALAFVLIYTNTIRRVWGLSALIVMSIALALTQSVGAILLGIPASIVVILVALYGRRSILPIAGVGILGGVGFGILTQISARFANILDLSNGTNFFRLRVWESALEIIQDYPLTGIGLDQFLYMFRGHYIRPDAIWDRDLSHPHNVILDYWTRLGLAGVILFIIIQVSFWRNCLHAVRNFTKRDPLMLALSIGLMGSMADLLAHGWIDNSVFVYDLAFIFAFQLSLSIGLQQIQSRDEL